MQLLFISVNVCVSVYPTVTPKSMQAEGAAKPFRCEEIRKIPELLIVSKTSALIKKVSKIKRKK